MSANIRVSLPGFNALTSNNPDEFALIADENNVLIKEQSRGSGTVSLSSSVTITHSLGYIPFYLVYGEISTNTYRLVNAQDPVGSGWKSHATTTTLVITNLHSNTYTGYRYYIFYDSMSNSGSPSIAESDAILKVSKSGVNALTSVNPNDYIFHSDLNTFKILAEGKLTSQSVTGDPTIFTVSHGQSQIPAVIGFAKFPDGYVSQAGSKERADNTAPVERYWRIETDTSNIRFLFYKGGTANYSVDIKYYLFEGPAT